MHLIFDLDGTLVDSRPGILFSLRQAVRQVMVGANPDDLEFRIGVPVREMFKRTLKKPSRGLLDQLEAAFRVSYDGEGWTLSAPYPGVIETLNEFQALEVPMYIVTNKPGFSTGQILSHLGMESYFLEVVSPDSRHPKFKGKTESLRAVLDKYDLEIGRAHV
jgi:phosphoglycolate phosphatase